MALTFTGSKYSGNLTSVGTLTLTDSGASFTASDFDQGVAVQGGQRIAVLWNNALTLFKGVALIDAQTSGTVLKLLTPFLDPLTGDEVTQVVGGSADAYTVSQNMADLVGGALTQNEFQFTTTDEIIWGIAADPDGITFYDENITLLLDDALVGGSGMNMEFRGGYIQFGKVLDWAAFVTSQGCHIMISDNANNAESMIVTDDECKLVVAGTVIHNHRHQGSRMGSGGGGTSGNGSEAKFQIYMNCSTNCNIASGPTTGQVWDANAADQRLINLDYWGTGNTGTNGSGVGVRWGDGVIIGGSYGFSREDGSIGLFGADANITHDIGPLGVAGVTGQRLRVLNILQSGSKTAFYRTNGTPTCAVTLINILTDDRRAGTGVSPASAANNNVTMDFTFEEIYTGLVQNTRLVVDRDVDSVVADSDVAGADGQALIRLLHEEVTGHTSDNKFTAFAMGCWMYGFDPVIADIDESTTPVLSGTAEDLIFGGALVQPPDLGITQSTQATVAAYTDINNTDRLYDRAADWKMLTDANAQYPTVQTKLIVNEGTLAAVVVGTDLVIDSGAAAVFAVNTGTDLLTIDCALTFDPGATFEGIKADNITFLNLATLGVGLKVTVSGKLTIDTSQSWTDAVISGDLDVDAGGAAATVTFIDATEFGTSSSQDNYTIDTPANAEGDLLLWFACNGDSGDPADFNTPSGWTEDSELGNLIVGGAPSFGKPGMSLFYKFSNGSEPSTFNITTNPTQTNGLCGQMLCFRGVDLTTPFDVTTTTAIGDSTDADPPSIGSGSSSDEYLPVIVRWHEDVVDVGSSVPSGYTDSGNGNTTGIGGSDGCTMQTAYRNSGVSPAAAEDPGVFVTLDEQWGAATIALRPIAGAGGGLVLNFDNVEVTGNILNIGGGTLTINAINGTVISTSEPGTGNGQVNIVQPVPITIHVTDTLGVDIQNARVRILADETVGSITTGDVILTGLTNASGIVEDLAFNYEDAFDPSGLDCLLTVRQGSVTPFKKPLEDKAIVITSIGFNTEEALVSDE